jgi:26S proteasome regulatory subunit N1
MAKDGERSTAANKGKGKVDDARELNGEKKDGKDEKQIAANKKDSNEEDFQQGKHRSFLPRS